MSSVFDKLSLPPSLQNFQNCGGVESFNVGWAEKKTRQEKSITELIIEKQEGKKQEKEIGMRQIEEARGVRKTVRP